MVLELLSLLFVVLEYKIMKLITPKRSTKQLEKGFLYEVVSEVDSFGYFKVREPVNPGFDFHGRVWHIHKNNMKKVRIV